MLYNSPLIHYQVNTQPYNNNSNNMIFFHAFYLIKQPDINDYQPSAVIISPHFAQADNDCLRLLIIDVGLLIKHNALKNHVIVIVKMPGTYHYGHACFI